MPRVGGPAASSASLLQAIHAEIGPLDCDTDAQCHSLGVGVRPCGGPEAFLVWSSKTAQSERLASLVGAHRKARREENARSGMISDCRVLADPGAMCRPLVSDGQRICQLGPEQPVPRD